MGPFGYFQRRRERESAVPPGDEAASFGFPEDDRAARGDLFTADGDDPQPGDQELTPGQQHDVAQLFQMVGAALRTGQFQIEETKTMSAPGDDAGDDADGGGHVS